VQCEETGVNVDRLFALDALQEIFQEALSEEIEPGWEYVEHIDMGKGKEVYHIFLEAAEEAEIV